VNIWAVKMKLGLPELTESTCNKVDVVMIDYGTRGVSEALWWMWLSSWKGPKRRERLSTDQLICWSIQAIQMRLSLPKLRMSKCNKVSTKLT